MKPPPIIKRPLVDGKRIVRLVRGWLAKRNWQSKGPKGSIRPCIRGDARDTGGVLYFVLKRHEGVGPARRRRLQRICNPRFTLDEVQKSKSPGRSMVKGT